MEYISCPMCGVDNAELLFLGRDRKTGMSAEYKVVKCRGCELVYVNPRPTFEAIKRWYYSDESPIDSFRPLPKTARLRDKILAMISQLHAHHRVRWIKKHIAINDQFRVLDVGCGFYTFLYTLSKKEECQVYGVDVNPAMVRYAKDQLGMNAFEGTLESIRFEDDFFDLATAWHVIEHDMNPMATLHELKRVIRKGGYLILETPNAESAPARFFKDRWLAAAMIPQHIILYSPATLEMMLVRCGFQVIQTFRVPSVGNPITTSILYSLGFQDFHRPSVRNLFLGAVILFLWPINLAMNLFLPDNIRVIAQKKVGHSSSD